MPQATKNLVHALTNVITAIVARPGRLDWLVVNVESIGTFLSKPTQQLRSKVFRLQMDVWGLSLRHGISLDRPSRARLNSAIQLRGFSAEVSDGVSRVETEGRPS